MCGCSRFAGMSTEPLILATLFLPEKQSTVLLEKLKLKKQIKNKTTMKTRFFIYLLAAVAAFSACKPNTKEPVKTEPVMAKWTVEQANAWAAENGWLRGSNFNPSTAINQLE